MNARLRDSGSQPADECSPAAARRPRAGRLAMQRADRRRLLLHDAEPPPRLEPHGDRVPEPLARLSRHLRVCAWRPATLHCGSSQFSDHLPEAQHASANPADIVAGGDPRRIGARRARDSRRYPVPHSGRNRFPHQAHRLAARPGGRPKGGEPMALAALHVMQHRIGPLARRTVTPQPTPSDPRSQHPTRRVRKQTGANAVEAANAPPRSTHGPARPHPARPDGAEG